MKILIRKAYETDFPEIIDLIKEFALFQKTPEKVSISLGQMIKDKDIFRCLVAVVENEIVGLVSVSRCNHRLPLCFAFIICAPDHVPWPECKGGLDGFQFTKPGLYVSDHLLAPPAYRGAPAPL